LLALFLTLTDVPLFQILDGRFRAAKKVAQDQVAKLTVAHFGGV
jgi:hypothetical protein